VLVIFLQGLALAVSSLGVEAQESPTVPELPGVIVENLSADVRNQIQQAYADARAHPRDAAASGRLGMVLHTYGLLKQAALTYRRANRLAADAFRWIYYLGVVETAEGHCDTAIQTFRLALRRNPEYLPAQLQLANCLLASADWEGSAQQYADIAQQQPDSADAYYGLGRVRAARHDVEAAAEAYRKACALFPDFGAAHYALALTYQALGAPKQAEEERRLYERNRAGAPPAGDQLLAEVRALNRSAGYQVQIGADLERQGRLEESAAAHEKALEIDSQFVQAHINLIQLYGRLGQFEKAEEHYRAAVRLNPSAVEGYYNYGVLLLSAGKYEQSEGAFLKTVEIDPFHAGAHNNLGYLLERRGKSLEAVAEYRQAVENKPGDRQAHFNLGRVLINQKKYREGIQQLEKTLEPEDENTPRYIYALGAALARSGDHENALRYIRRAREGAAARGQSDLVANIDRDLHTLETPGIPQ
jgi:tetratricopeptide (TPR) repeat protein